MEINKYFCSLKKKKKKISFHEHMVSLTLMMKTFLECFMKMNCKARGR